jgi:type IV pilus assembly protein PilY1
MAGEHSYEGTTTSTEANLKLQLNDNFPLRKRKDNYVLGDIINSSPLVFNDLSANKTKVIVFGANDGMLHFIRADKGIPIASYLPSQALPQIKDLAKQDYIALHKPFVDSSPGIYIGPDNNKIIIYGTFGLGLEGAYAIDASVISTIKKDDIGDPILWELKKNRSDYVGKVKDTPTIIMAKDRYPNTKKRPFLIMNSGYHANEPGLLIVDLLKTHANEKSPLIVNIISHEDMKKGYKNANSQTYYDIRGYNYNGGTAGAVISTPTVSDLTGTDYYEAIYFGDSYGKVWKVDLQNETVTNNIACWGYSGKTYSEVTNIDFKNCTNYHAEKTKAKAIFQAHDADGKPQPITTKIAIGYHHEGIGIAFGTGSYDLSVDGSLVSATYNKTQSVYMIRDLSGIADVNASNLSNNITRSKLLKLVHVTNNGKESLQVQKHGQNGDIKYGFYFDLHEGKGERVNVDPLFVNKYLFVAANTPVLSSECDGGGTGAVYQFTDWRDPTQQEIEIDKTKWLINKLDYVSIGGKTYIIVSGDGGSSDDKNQPHEEKPIQITIPLIINSSWLRLY